MLDFLWLVVSLGVILGGCEVFTNGIEWTGKKLKFAEGVVGSLMAAVGTALPETLIPIIAILFHTESSSHQVGIGAIAGAPFMLSTLTLFVMACAVYYYKGRRQHRDHLSLDSAVIGRDMAFFLVTYPVAIAVGMFHQQAFKWFVVAYLVGIYLYYVYLTLKAEGDVHHDVNPLHFARNHHDPYLHIIGFQVVAGLALIVGGAHFFVKSVANVAPILNISPLVLSMIITPVATELPEKLNSVIWVRRGKDTMALGNITGALVFQSCFPVAIGIAFTPWVIEGVTLVSAFLAIGSILYHYLWLRARGSLNTHGFLLSGLFYLIFLFFAF